MAFEGVKRRVADARERRPLLDQVMRTVEHYSAVKGNLQAGAVTYFAFISCFPLLALAFAVIGYVARIYPDAEEDLIEAINTVLPGLVGEGSNQVSIEDISAAAPGILSVGIIVVLYSGLGWISSMRDALTVMMEMPVWIHPSFVVGKLRDLVTMVALGVVLFLSVGVSGAVRGLSKQILDALGLGVDLGWLLGLLAVVIGLAVNALLFYGLFRLLLGSDLPFRALVSGAVLGALGFEILKQISQRLLQATSESPAFQAFGIALILVVWINYASRVIMYAAAWAYVHPASRAERPAPHEPVQGPQSPPADFQRGEEPTGRGWAGPFAAGVTAALAAVAVLRKRG